MKYNYHHDGALELVYTLDTPQQTVVIGLLRRKHVFDDAFFGLGFS
jgi:hypothetical protein